MSCRPRYHLNVVGDFYVEDGCCTRCGVPEAGGDLFSHDEDHCFVAQQPETMEELRTMVGVMWAQELNCIRYDGTDQAILRRLAENGLAPLCNFPPPADAVELRFDHVSFHSPAKTGRELLATFVAYVEKWRATTIEDDGVLASVSVAWYGDNFHRLEARRSEGAWLVRHETRGLTDTIHDWLVHIKATEIRWQTAAQYQARGPWRPEPW